MFGHTRGMIVTFTPNPSVDTTVRIDTLVRGGMVRASESTRQPGGKGINVAHALHKAHVPTVAIAPASSRDLFTALARAADIPLSTVEVSEVVRTNTTLSEPNGTTTKINEPGSALSPDTRTALEATLLARASRADAIVLAGSLPPLAPSDWYSTLIRRCRHVAPELFIAVDTSGPSLRELGEALPAAAPDLLAPNALELSQLLPNSGINYKQLADEGLVRPIIDAARTLVNRGIREVLVTLGGAGACLATADGAWYCPAESTAIQSTAGAGDSALAGFLIARRRGADAPETLRHAVAYGTAAASRPGTAVIAPADARLDHTPHPIAYHDLR